MMRGKRKLGWPFDQPSWLAYFYRIAAGYVVIGGRGGITGGGGDVLNESGKVGVEGSTLPAPVACSLSITPEGNWLLSAS